jgi:hypothetical protein
MVGVKVRVAVGVEVEVMVGVTVGVLVGTQTRTRWSLVAPPVPPLKPR